MRIRTSRQVLTYLALSFMAVLVLMPFLWTALMSLKLDRDLLSIPPTFLPNPPTLFQYRETFRNGDFLNYFQNSIIVSLASTALALAIGVPAAYGFAQFRYRLSGVLFGVIVATRMFPPVTLIIPYFLFMRWAGLLDTHLALIITYVTIALPLVIWILEGFFRELPKEVVEAAQIDGLGPIGVFMRIGIPLSMPAVSVAASLAFIAGWNEFIFALALTRTPEAQTVPVGLASGITSQGFDFGPITAGATLYVVPVLLFTFLAQKGLVKGLATGGSTG
jgi:ABC-type glycerol-3-phosphate transport system permease component